MITTILGILKGLFESMPVIKYLLDMFKKTTQQKIDEDVENLRNEIDEFKRTGRPNEK